MDYVPFAEPTERSFDDVFFGEWLEDPIAFGAFEGDKLIGYVEGSIAVSYTQLVLADLLLVLGLELLGELLEVGRGQLLSLIHI